MLWETLPTLTWHASSCSQQPPRGMLHPAANRNPKATHPWLLLGVQACRLPALKTIQTLQTLKLACFILQPTGTPRSHIGMLHPAANRHPKATHPWLLMGVQACRLPALKSSCSQQAPWLLLGVQACRLPALKPSKRSKPLNWHASSCSQQAPQGHTLACFILQPTGTPRPHIHGFLWASKPAVCQPLNAPNAPNP